MTELNYEDLRFEAKLNTGMDEKTLERQRVSLRVFDWFKNNCKFNRTNEVMLSDLYENYGVYCETCGMVPHSKRLFSSLLMENLQAYVEKGSVAKMGRGRVSIKGVEIKN